MAEAGDHEFAVNQSWDLSSVPLGSEPRRVGAVGPNENFIGFIRVSNISAPGGAIAAPLPAYAGRR
jgi:hypothetical protein